MSSFFLFSRDKPPASSLIFALGLTLGLGLGFELPSRVEPVVLGLGLITTKGLYFLTSVIFYI